MVSKLIEVKNEHVSCIQVQTDPIVFVETITQVNRNADET